MCRNKRNKSNETLKPRRKAAIKLHYDTFDSKTKAQIKIGLKTEKFATFTEISMIFWRYG